MSPGHSATRRISRELDFGYFLTNNPAMERILSGKKHGVTAGAAAIASVALLPQTAAVAAKPKINPVIVGMEARF